MATCPRNDTHSPGLCDKSYFFGLDYPPLCTTYRILYDWMSMLHKVSRKLIVLEEAGFVKPVSTTIMYKICVTQKSKLYLIKMCASILYTFDECILFSGFWLIIKDYFPSKMTWTSYVRQRTLCILFSLKFKLLQLSLFPSME